jgi:hypothetical protein
MTKFVDDLIKKMKAKQEESHEASSMPIPPRPGDWLCQVCVERTLEEELKGAFYFTGFKKADAPPLKPVKLSSTDIQKAIADAMVIINDARSRVVNDHKGNSAQLSKYRPWSYLYNANDYLAKQWAGGFEDIFEPEAKKK